MAQRAADARFSKLQQHHRRRLSNSEQPSKNSTRHTINEATTAYIKRILCADIAPPTSPMNVSTLGQSHEQSSETLEQLLPPLTSSNEVDVQSYAFIAVILNVFVQSWYNRITPDQEFVAWVVQIIAHCTKELEQRLRHVDLESLLLDELPELMLEHLDAIRISHDTKGTRLTAAEVCLRYQILRPHVAMDPAPSHAEAVSKQHDNEVAWCLLLLNRLLPFLLPQEDLQNPCLEVLVSEIFSELIFHNGICGNACEPWLVWDGITKLLRTLRPAGLYRERAIDSTAGDPNDTSASGRARRHEWLRQRFDAVNHTFWAVIQHIVMLCLFIRSASIAVMHASSIQARALPPLQSLHGSTGYHAACTSRRDKTHGTHTSIETRPIIDMHVWGCMSELLILRKRAPWLSGMLSLLRYLALYGPGQICCANSRLDRLFSLQVHERVLNSRWIPTVLEAARSAIFPNNVLAPARTPPTDKETTQIKRECAAAIVDALPAGARTRFFATRETDQMRADIECELDLLGYAYLNKHLVIRVVELLVARLFPELAFSTAEGAAGVEERT